MPRKRSLEETFETLHKLRKNPTSEESLRKLKRVLTNEGCHAVARAASIARDFEITPLAPDLVAAFDRFMADPVGTDKGCVAKTAIVEALLRLGHEDEAIFLRGINHVQMEPVYGGRVDTAVGVRGACAIGLAQTHFPGVLVELAHLLADPESAVRGSAARAIAAHGRDAGVPLLHLKAVTGDPEPQVMTECLAALLTLAPATSLGFVAGFLDKKDTLLSEAAALALGESRIAGAFDVLRNWYERGLRSELRRTALLVTAMLRRDEALDFLLSVVREGAAAAARDALAALGIYRENPTLRERILRAAAGRSELRETVTRTFGPTA